MPVPNGSHVSPVSVPRAGKPVAGAGRSFPLQQNNQNNPQLPIRLMKHRLNARPAILICACVLAVGVCAVRVNAQSVPEKPAGEPAAKSKAVPAQALEEEIVELSPFEVTASANDSYEVLNSNSLTNFNAELGKLPISADVFTEAFMEDINGVTLENMLRDFAAGSGTGSVGGDLDGSEVFLPMDRGSGAGVSTGVMLRGLGAAVLKQDNFMLPSPVGTGMNRLFGVERVEVINGPQALLYGHGGGGGVMNTISMQARFMRRSGGTIRYQIDSDGHYNARLDYRVGSRRMAVAVSLLADELGDYRLWLGGRLEGAYTQLAFRLGTRHVLRLTGKYTYFDRFTQRSITLNAGSIDNDARHGMPLKYLLATGQIGESATGPSGAGLVGNGYINWKNVDSYLGEAGGEETTATMASAILESKWSRWFSTQVAVGHQNRDSRFFYGGGHTFYSPTASGNPSPGDWTIRIGGTSRAAWASQPARSTSARFSGLLTNSLFSGKARSQTMFGVDYTKSQYANVDYVYFQADEDFNIRTNSSGVRMRMENYYWTVNDGPVRNSLAWNRGDNRVYYNGMNAIIGTYNLEDPSLITPENPRGLLNTQRYLHSQNYNRGAYAVNFTQWGRDGRLTSLLGVRYMSIYNRQQPSRPGPDWISEADTFSFSAGLNYDLNRWLRAYAAVSDTHNLPEMALNTTVGPHGQPLPVSHSIGQEVGLKIGAGARKISGSISYYELHAKNEPYAIRSEVRSLINPDGANGTYNSVSGSAYIPVDKKSYGVQAAVTASPVRGLNMRLSAALVKGTIGSDTSYATLYNDKFHVNDTGQLTFGAGGPVVYVRSASFSSTPSATPRSGYEPLTVDMLSNPGSLYYANPHPDNGHILNDDIITLLQSQAGPASIITGEAGRPISEYQLTGVTPLKRIETSRNGERTTGYPEVSCNLVTTYTVPSGAWRGFKIGATVGMSFKIADLYYYENGYYDGAPRKIFMRPDQYRYNLLVGYQRRIGKVVFSTQINVNNVFNDSEILIRPNGIWGYNERTSTGGAVRLAAYRTMQPRTITWTNSVKF